MAHGEFVLEGGKGVAIPLRAGEGVEIENTYGRSEVMSMEHTRSRLSTAFPRAGDDLYSSRRRPMLRFESDTSPGVHDTLLCACSPEIYRELGAPDDHRSCETNFHEALATVGVSLPFTPGPFNLFMNVSVGPGGTLLRGDPVSRSGDRVVLRARIDVFLVLSACPQDITPINGPDRTPRDVLIRHV